jgi:hypothetical protein
MRLREEVPWIEGRQTIPDVTIPLPATTTPLRSRRFVHMTAGSDL